MLLSTAACSDDFGKGNNADDGIIRFEIVSDAIADSRSGEPQADTIIAPATVVIVKQKYLPIVVEGDTLTLCITELPADPQHFSAKPEPNATNPDATPDSRSQFYDQKTTRITSFHGVAYTEENGGTTHRLFFDEDYDDPDGDGIISTGRFWPNDGTHLSFYSYAGNKPYAFSAGKPEIYQSGTDTRSIKFSYKMPAPAGADAGNYSDAENQPDIVFSISKDNAKDASAVPLHFQHALSAITFKTGSLPMLTKVKHIALEGCYTEGKCEARWVSNEDASFTWTDRAGSEDYWQTFGDTYTGTPAQIGGNEKTFLIIPQELGTQEINLKITFQIGTFSNPSKPLENEWHTYVMEKELSKIIDKFEPEKRYYFTIGIPEEVDVDVTDDVNKVGDTWVKNNVKITNTGIAEGYIRASIVGYWLRTNSDLTEDIVASWSIYDATVGTVNWGANWSTYWVKGTDEFYYCKPTVLRYNDTPVPLFESYTLTSAPPIADAFLEICIVAQIVHKDYLNEAWTIPSTP